MKAILVITDGIGYSHKQHTTLFITPKSQTMIIYLKMCLMV